MEGEPLPQFMLEEIKHRTNLTSLAVVIMLVTISSTMITKMAFDANREWHVSCIDKTVNWPTRTGDFAADEDSIELVIGVNKAKNVYNSLGDLACSFGGKIVDTVSVKDEVVAIVADIPRYAVYSFGETLLGAGLARYVEPNMKVQAQFIPNDPNWTIQWGPKKIEADWAWNTTTGNHDVLVAVVDTGIDYTHPEIAPNYVSGGYDWVLQDSDPMDDHGHGTHCAGIIAATLNNSIGIAGLAQVRVMAEKVLCSAGWGLDSWVADGIYHATDAGARIISMSLGGPDYSVVMHDAVKYAYDHGVLIVVAAGNEGNDMEFYPAAYEEVVAVTATDSSDKLARFSSYGNWVELSAPGVGIYSTLPGNSYASWSGTSMACPHVSGVSALVWSRFPNYTNAQILHVLKRSADDLGDFGFDEYYGYGRVNARKAIIGIPEHDMIITGWQNPHRIDPGKNGIFNLTISNYGSSDETDISVQFLVNSTLIDSKQIDSLESCFSTMLSFSWNTSTLSNYNFTCYIVPVPGENITENNGVSVMVQVRFPTVLRVPEEYPTIKQAVNNASNQDTVLVSEGYYAEGEIDIFEDGVALIADGYAILDGQRKSYVLNIDAEQVVVEGFEIRNGSKYQVNMKGFGNTLTGNNIHCNNTNSTNGIRLYTASNCTISFNNITTPPNWFPYQVYMSCIMIERSSNNTIRSNALKGGSLFVQGSQHNLLVSNRVTDGNFGLVLAVSPNNTMRNNIMANNSRNFCVLKSDFDEYPMLKNPSEAINDIDTSNTVNGKPIYYWINVHNRAVPSDAGCVVLIYCSSIKIENLDLRNNLDGVLLLSSNGTTINRNNIVANTGYPWQYDCGGIAVFFESSNIIITSNNLTSNEASIWFMGGPNCTVYRNNITNSKIGLFIDNANSLVSSNNLTDNWDAMYVYGSNHTVVLNNVVGTQNFGVRIMGSNHFVKGNNLLSGNTGLELDFITNSTVCSNSIVDTIAWPMWLFGASNNLIFHNNFINYGWPVRIQWFSANTWHNGYPSGGNYWSNYTGVDHYSGPDQDVTGSDGLGDTPYVMDEDNIDRYPLMTPWVHIVGDINQDGRIDVKDLVLVVKHYASYPSHPEWDPNADVNGDLKVDIKDLVLVIKHYGEHQP
jgi:parallel beta-helix repeat protein